MPGPLSSAIQFDVDILGTARDVKGDAAGTNTNTITAQLGDVVAQQATEQNAAWVQHVGFCSRPSNAVAGRAAAQGVVLSGSSQSYCVASRDLRGQQLYANLQPGESAMYAGGAAGAGQARVLCKATGDVVLYATSDNTATGQGCYLKIGPSGFRIESPNGRIVMDATGIHIIHASGARIDLGGIGGLSSPIDQVSSYCQLTAATVHCNGGIATQLGPLPSLNAAASLVPVPGVPIPTTAVGGPSGVAPSGNVMITP